MLLDKSSKFGDICRNSFFSGIHVTTQGHQRRSENAVGVAHRDPDTHVTYIDTESYTPVKGIQKVTLRQ
ncbi:hypothetical protein SAMN05421812_12950 [Asanoa hainanensis]|uniref:Uncharacterized protein n=1 Tax=Asanoa hainanensis TaxID=560556 RepID=A0A239PG08_9ACTN|nr:hypothetical protein SAMN05421812_12950 [Asanoa hainanensis]